jgi:hypothetical protein
MDTARRTRQTSLVMFKWYPSEATLINLLKVSRVSSHAHRADRNFGSDQRGRRRHIPEIPHSVLDELLVALEAAHADLLQPPASLVVQPEKLARWQTECHSTIKPVVDWNEFQKRQTSQGEDSHLDEQQTEQAEDIEEGEEPLREDKEAETLTIGLIGEYALVSAPTAPLSPCFAGQPNCGKSSLLNALMGRSTVRASKTPGKVGSHSVHLNVPSSPCTSSYSDQALSVYLLVERRAHRRLSGSSAAFPDRGRNASASGK